MLGILLDKEFFQWLFGGLFFSFDLGVKKEHMEGLSVNSYVQSFLFYILGIHEIALETIQLFELLASFQHFVKYLSFASIELFP